ncbi:hypothetical protein WICPIJ_002908 [Wickerhamomyces pijperi]|uniref:Uncharacterized protein n=1 Tax=Wickerhamomyces pijperi TaxID=599730 RepID=A0A9P8QAY5_WICPI|nr:hypothetical protein WICPIJ_002908 [Wickerhamomyces pijperi]
MSKKRLIRENVWRGAFDNDRVQLPSSYQWLDELPDLKIAGLVGILIAFNVSEYQNMLVGLDVLDEERRAEEGLCGGFLAVVQYEGNGSVAGVYLLILFCGFL